MKSSRDAIDQQPQGGGHRRHPLDSRVRHSRSRIRLVDRPWHVLEGSDSFSKATVTTRMRPVGRVGMPHREQWKSGWTIFRLVTIGAGRCLSFRSTPPAVEDDSGRHDAAAQLLGEEHDALPTKGAMHGRNSTVVQRITGSALQRLELVTLTWRPSHVRVLLRSVAFAIECPQAQRGGRKQPRVNSQRARTPQS